MPLNNQFYIGYDGGGTKTICMLGDSNGTILTTAVGASTNLKSRSEEDVKHVVQELLESVIEKAKIEKELVRHVFVSTAGGDREEDRARWKNWICEKGIDLSRIVVANDAVAALAAGTRSTSGNVLIAGTGSIAYSVQDGLPKPIRVGGWGYLLGDEGSGYDIGNHALRKILRSFDGRDDKCEEFTEYVLSQLGLERPDQLITFIYENPYPRKLIASIAKHIMTLAEQGEVTARNIIQEAVNRLIELVTTVSRNNKEKDALPLVISGGLFHSTYFKEVFENSLKEASCDVPIISPQYPPVVGSYICALLQDQELVTDEIEQNIHETWNKAMKVL